MFNSDELIAKSLDICNNSENSRIDIEIINIIKELCFALQESTIYHFSDEVDNCDKGHGCETCIYEQGCPHTRCGNEYFVCAYKPKE